MSIISALVLLIHLTLVTADYHLLVRVHNFTLLPFGCCDRYDEVGECIGNDRCDHILKFCTRPLGSSPNTDPYNIADCQPSTSGIFEVYSTEVAGSWSGRQIYIQAYDNDFYEPRDFVESFSIDVEQIPIGVETEPQTFNGTFGFGWIELSFRIDCSISHYYACEYSCLLIGNCTCLPEFEGQNCDENLSSDHPSIVTDSANFNYGPAGIIIYVVSIIVSALGGIVLIAVVLSVTAAAFLIRMQRKKSKPTISPQEHAGLQITSENTNRESCSPTLQAPLFLLQPDQNISTFFKTDEDTNSKAWDIAKGLAIDTRSDSNAEYEAESCFGNTSYIDHTIMTFDSSGGVCEFENCTISIPRGSIPKDAKKTVEIGVTISTELIDLSPQDKTPVSPIILLCVLNDPSFKFIKPVTIQILHCLDISSDEDVKEMDLHFFKSQHNLPCFHITDGEEDFPANTHHGTLTIDHFCSFCIAASKDSIKTSSVYHYIMCALPKEITCPRWDIVYCIVPITCGRVVEKQYSSAYFETKKIKVFKFKENISSDPYIELNFERELDGGWHLALLLGTKIRASDVDYTQFESNVLEQLEEDKLYPPRFTIMVNRVTEGRAATLSLTFTGSVDDFTTEVVLDPLNQGTSTAKDQNRISSSTSLATMAAQDLAPNQNIDSQSLSSITSAKDSAQLNKPPTHRELMNHIAVNIPTKWRDIGVQLGLRVADLDAIEGRHFHDFKRCFSDMFNLWEQQLTSPYCWSTILEALTSPLLGELRLAQAMRHMLSVQAQEEAAAGNVHSTQQ